MTIAERKWSSFSNKLTLGIGMLNKFREDKEKELGRELDMVEVESVIGDYVTWLRSEEERLPPYFRPLS